MLLNLVCTARSAIQMYRCNTIHTYMPIYVMSYFTAFRALGTTQAWYFLQLQYHRHLCLYIPVTLPHQSLNSMSVLYRPGLSRPILKNLGFLGFFKKTKKPEKLGF